MNPPPTGWSKWARRPRRNLDRLADAVPTPAVTTRPVVEPRAAAVVAGRPTRGGLQVAAVALGPPPGGVNAGRRLPGIERVSRVFSVWHKSDKPGAIDAGREVAKYFRVVSW